jgi:hypothetical protein
MTERPVVAVLAGAIVGLALACGQQTGPSKVPTPIPVTVVSLKITGPDAIAPGQTVSFTATGLLSNGKTEDDTRKVAWSAFPATSVLTIAPDTGQATAQASGDVAILAAYQGGASCCQARITRTVLPPNTYRLTGTVSESGFSVQSATVAVLSGIGTGLSTTTDSGGAYRLYGVAGTIQIRFSKAGYDDIVKTFTATRNDVLDFPEAHQTAAIPSLAGTYTLTLTADTACPTTATKGIAALPDDFRQSRRYAASLTQNGPAVTVILTDPAIVPKQNRFTGHIGPDGIEFWVGDAYFYYGYYGIAEQLSTTQEFEFQGLVRAQRNGNTIVGSLNGALDILTEPGDVLSALCLAANSQVTLTRAAQPSRGR